jgi:hypothetical protein
MSKNDNIYRSYYAAMRDLEKSEERRLNEARVAKARQDRLELMVADLMRSGAEVRDDLLYTQETYKELHDAVREMITARQTLNFELAQEALNYLDSLTLEAPHARSTIRADVQGINRDTATRADDSWDSKCGPEGAHLRVALHA